MPNYLYVEDDPLSREVMQLIVEGALGADLILFADSTDFMARLQDLPERPEVILLDIHMKPHTGFELLEMLRAEVDYAYIPVIALTASVMNEEVEKLRMSGFNGAIAKPLSIQTFPMLLNRILNGEAVWHIIDSF